MKIRYKLAFQFSLIVGIILLIFSEIIYYRAELKRENNFYGRLSKRASTTAKYLTEVEELSPTLMKILDKKSLNRLNGEEVFVFDTTNKLIYSNIDKLPKEITSKLLNQIIQKSEVRFEVFERQYIGFLFEVKANKLMVIESAIDDIGKNDLINLRGTLIISYLIIIVIVVLSGVFFSGQALQPIKAINKQINQITVQNLRKRVDEGKNKDEIAELAANFNLMLQRLELGFEQQRSFVSHASHELRTPLSAMKTEIQIALDERLSIDEYENTLANLLKDTERLIALSNGLLQLAKTIDNTQNFKTEKIRIEELLFAIIDANKSSLINVSFKKIPINESVTTVFGIKTLLKNVFVNLIENGVKYSSNQPIKIEIDFDEKNCLIHITDTGIGVPPDDLPKIFSPFYRSENALEIQGFGIGLSVCQKIIDLHKGTITVQSLLHRGSTFTVTLPHI